MDNPERPSSGAGNVGMTGMDRAEDMAVSQEAAVDLSKPVGPAAENRNPDAKVMDMTSGPDPSTGFSPMDCDPPPSNPPADIAGDVDMSGTKDELSGGNDTPGILSSEGPATATKPAAEPPSIPVPENLSTPSEDPAKSQSIPKVPSPVDAKDDMEVAGPTLGGQEPANDSSMSKPSAGQEASRISPTTGLVTTPKLPSVPSVPVPAKPKSIFATLFPAATLPKPPVAGMTVSAVPGLIGQVHSVQAKVTTATLPPPVSAPTSAAGSLSADKPVALSETAPEQKDAGKVAALALAPDAVKVEDQLKSVSQMDTTPAVEPTAVEMTAVGSARMESPNLINIGTVTAGVIPSAQTVTPMETIKGPDFPPKSSLAAPVEGVPVGQKPETSSTPMPTAIKSEVKQPPIAAKTMRRDSRKASTTSPTTSSGEQKKKSKSTGSPGWKARKKRPPPKEDGQDGRNDFYCWICHKEGEVLCCELCPRVFHAKCLHMTVEPEGDWFCPECEKITEAECKETQSRAMSMLTIDQFSLLLKYVIQRMKLPMSEPFHEPVDTKMFPDYLDYVFHPMDLSTIEKNVKKRKYGCPEAFVIDFRWVIHNCIIYNSPHSKLTQTAKSMLKVAERELNEIEVCPECYLNSCRKRENWFCEPCKELHPLVWAKLQGFPHWPAKALRIEKGLVDVRFFGQHDRAWIPLAGCYLISKELPLPVKNKKKGKGPGMRGGLDNAMLEMQGYIDNIRKITGEFEFAPPRTLLTHCDLYRRSGTLSMSTGKGRLAAKQESSKGKAEGQADGKSMTKGDGSDNKAKIELKDISGGKELGKGSLSALTPKKVKLVTTSGEHPARSFATKKKKASLEFLKKTIESCRASLGIENLQDVRMNSGSDETSSSSEEENEGDENKDDAGRAEKNVEEPAASSAPAKPSNEDDDSDAELVIDLGDMEESTDAADGKSSAGKSGDAASSSKSEDVAVKKRRTDESSDKQPAGKPLKSILMNAPKSSDKDERKKMLAKALSERIATGKRKHDVEGTSSGAPSTKVRKTQDPHERRSGSPVGKFTHPKDKKKSHHGKDISSKPKSGILKPSSDSSGLRKEGHTGSEKRPSDPLKHKHKDGRDAAQKVPGKKQQPTTDKSNRLDKIPTGADARKLFNGGRIPRKNQISNASDEEVADKEQEERDVVMDATQTSDIVTRRKSLDRNNPPARTPNTVNGVNRRTSVDAEKRMPDENITFSSLKKYSDKVMDTVQKVFYEMYNDMMVPLRTNVSPDKPADAATASAMHQVAQMRLELERLKWMHEQEMAELKHNHDLTVAEIRQSLENEKKQHQQQAEAEKNRLVEETKRKQWCAHCNKEAIFYCCWNTSYCDYPCQQKHWPQHMNSCTQAGLSGGAATTPGAGESKTIPPPKSTASSRILSLPSTTGGKISIAVSAPGMVSKPTSSTKSMIVLPSSLVIAKQTPASLSKSIAKTSTASEKIVKVSATATSGNADKAGPPQQPKSGFAISAIGARLLAAKQRTTPNRETDAALTKIETTASLATPSTAFADHVKTTLDSPLSPDAKPPSPTSEVSPLVMPTKSVTTTGDKTKVKLLQKPALPDPASVSVKPKVEAPPIVSTIMSAGIKTKDTQGAAATTALTKTGLAKRPLSSTILGFSSPSVVASMITDMDTPLSSSLSSGESSSFTDSPDKKEDKKVQLSATGSAFTKVIPDATKHLPADSKDTSEKSQKALSFSAKPAAAPPESAGSLASFKPIHTKPPDATPESPQKEALPVVAPVMADIYLSTLQHKLSQKGSEKAKTPPVTESSAEKEAKRPVNTELYRPVFYGTAEKKDSNLDDTISPT